MKGTDFKEFRDELLQDTNVRREYELLKPKYDFIQAIIARRNELSLSQRKLAEITGMHQPAICRLERGDRNTSIGTLFKVAQALGLQINLTESNHKDRVTV